MSSPDDFKSTGASECYSVSLWHPYLLIRTHPGREAVASAWMRDLMLAEVYYPKHKGQAAISGYVFARDIQHWMRLRACSAIVRLITSADSDGNVNPAIITEKQVAELRQREEDCDFEPKAVCQCLWANMLGTTIKVPSGIMTGHIGEIVQIGEKIKVRCELMKRDVYLKFAPVELWGEAA